MQHNAPAPAWRTPSPIYSSCVKLILLLVAQIPLLRASPLHFSAFNVHSTEEQPLPAESAALWIYLAVAIALVLLGGVFAGLTIALMGQVCGTLKYVSARWLIGQQDEIYLQVIRTSGNASEKKNAAGVLKLLKRGKHWVLVTLLLGNVITNETLPIVLDRSLGGGWPAVLGSTVLIVIFGEVIPQSVCVRYGLPIGAWMSPLVLVLMYILAPVAWPTAKLLDRLLGEDHGTTYRKAGLKTLVTLHKSLGDSGEQLVEDEVTIISAVLDLKAKPVGNIMTPMDDVFTMSSDTVLDEKTMELILSAGYSRIPIHAPNDEENFVGMLLVKMFITYDPEDCKRVSDFALATLPETRAETSCLDIVNFFQEGKSHMVLVSEFPGDDHGALGVVTLEDVIEELIGEEIIDESDVFIDVHKAIRRLAPAPKSRVPKGEFIDQTTDSIADGKEDTTGTDNESKDPRSTMRRITTTDGPVSKPNSAHPDSAVSQAKMNLRRSSSMMNTSDRESTQKKPNKPDLREHLKHLGPSNPASRPRTTRYNTVKVKPGTGLGSDSHRKSIDNTETRKSSFAAQSGIGAGLVSSAGKDASDGVLTVQAGYGSIPSSSPLSPPVSRNGRLSTHNEEELSKSRNRSKHHSRTQSQSTLGSMHSVGKSVKSNKGIARSGSITENIVDTGGIKKTVLELTSSSDDPEGNGGASVANGAQPDQKENQRQDGKGSKKKRRRRKRKDGGESEPLLGDED
ncbi:uncharacterized protein KY384_002613 [Bacidia gigantensis]|uniref:uncharacterized protein n=1 Tax=Bacidia gigantensis TaxID=2732470 RepID=UPI001D054180|nr:uncharacterized protein KY384_002613 [Bacidia gigantensis]KAG8532736.1 hypothetical protein KY384_002613 [Bacidia gigantensis]